MKLKLENQEMINKGIIYFLFSLIIGSCSLLSDIEEAEPIADLIIENIRYNRRAYNDSLWGGSWSYTFIVDVRNVGELETNNSFFISNSRSNSDYANQYFSHGQIVNYLNDTIRAGETFTDSIWEAFQNETELVLFIISAEGDTNRKGDDLPFVVESDYDNNSYTFQLVYD